MSAFTLTVRIVLTSATLVALLGPTFADAVAREDVPPPPAAGPSGAEEEDVRSRPSRRERRGTAPRDDTNAHDPADGPTAPSAPTSTTASDPAEKLVAPPADGDLLAELDLDDPSPRTPLPPELRDRLGRLPGSRSLPASSDLADAGAGGSSDGQAGPGGPGALKGGAGCSIQCITSGRAYGRGIGAELVLTTDTPAEMWLLVDEPGSGYTHYAYSGPERSTSFHHLFDELDQGTTYHVTAAAQDIDGEQSVAVGTFTTHRRHARVTFGGTTVTSHPFDGDFFFDHRIDDDWIEHLSVGHWPHPHNHPLGGTTDVELAGVGATLEVAFHVTQSPGPGEGDDVCEVAPPGGPPSYTDLCKTTVAAADVFELDADGPDGYPQARSFSATLTGANDDGLAIESFVEVEVSYEQ